MAETIKHLHKHLVKLENDVSVIKHILSQEGKLTAWAKKELEKARAEPDNTYVNLNDV